MALIHKNKKPATQGFAGNYFRVIDRNSQDALTGGDTKKMKSRALHNRRPEPGQTGAILF